MTDEQHKEDDYIEISIPQQDKKTVQELKKENKPESSQPKSSLVKTNHPKKTTAKKKKKTVKKKTVKKTTKKSRKKGTKKLSTPLGKIIPRSIISSLKNSYAHT